MSDLRIDYSHAEIDRRMRLLEMAAGDLDKAMRLECWVRLGVTDPDQMVRPIISNIRIIQAEPPYTGVAG